MTRTRNLLHASKLDAFLEWLVSTQGYILHPLSKHAYEVARFSEYTPSGDNPQIALYRRDRGEHLTVPAEATPLVLLWLDKEGSKRARRVAASKVVHLEDYH